MQATSEDNADQIWGKKNISSQKRARRFWSMIFDRVENRDWK